MTPAPVRAAEWAGIDTLDVVRILHAAGGALAVQAVLHGKLARIEWQEEKQRLLRLLLLALIGFACLLCLLLWGATLVLVVAWDTGYRHTAVAAMALLYGSGAAIAWWRIRALLARGAAFDASREELAADAALLKTAQ